MRSNGLKRVSVPTCARHERVDDTAREIVGRQRGRQWNRLIARLDARADLTFDGTRPHPHLFPAWRVTAQPAGDRGASLRMGCVPTRSWPGAHALVRPVTANHRYSLEIPE